MIFLKPLPPGFHIMIQLLSGKPVLWFTNIQNESVPHKERHLIQRRLYLDTLAAFPSFLRPDIHPYCTFWKVNSDLFSSCLHNRYYHDIRAIHILIFFLPARTVLWEIIEQRPHHRGSFFMSFLHQFPRIGAHIFTNP